MTQPLLALASTLLVQTLASLVLTAPSVLAPAVAPTLGLGAERVGLFVGAAYLAAMLSGLASGHWVARIGAVRLTQAAMLACALGGCAWLPWVGEDDEPAKADEPAAENAPASSTSTGPCTRKGRSWPEGSRVCEDHTVTRCFSDGIWRVIGSC